MPIRVTGVDRVLKNLRKEEKAMGHLINQGMENGGEIIARDAKFMLDDKDIDPTGRIAESIEVTTEVNPVSTITVVSATDERAMEVEMGPEGGFLFPSLMINRGRVVDAVATELRSRYK